MFYFVSNRNHSQTPSSLPTSKTNSELPSSRSRIIPEERKNCSLDDCFANETNRVIPVPPTHEATEEITSSKAGDTPTRWSRKYQWLLSEVRFGGDTDVNITSNINNLHPLHHKELYAVLEKLIAKAVPAWSLVLGT
ncbi:hypothetical protein BK809_0003730 [Diplodia seriata]|uniref:DUF4246 domain-containing protein n=1 Tax=Diplodia seriata TaxID=420778 RepID=A0A1S8BGC8_9PEZI|nr:hypothetical protein BK809_0003730 [Diplodia seriata]